MKPTPSIRTRLSRALLGWSIVWGMAVAAAIMLAVPHEVDELLDDTLQSSAEVLGILLGATPEALAVDRAKVRDAPQVRDRGAAAIPEIRFAWQVVSVDGLVLLRSQRSPTAPLLGAPTSGFSDSAQWRIYGLALPGDGSMLYVAQTSAERFEARFEVGLSATLAALAVGLLGHLWLRARVRHELAPLAALSQRLATHDPAAPGASLGEAEREELQPLQSAIDNLGQRLADRLASERAFTAHAAHALRTPLAGIDAQLAVALRESPPPVQHRIKRAREAAARLHRVVTALLTLFRSSAELRRQSLDIRALLAKLPVEGLTIEMHGDLQMDADADLLAAALLNLLDNSLRYGARHVRVSVVEPHILRIHDDGPGVSRSRRAEMQEAIDQTAEGRSTGLGLRLAELIARAHGGCVSLPDVAEGFAVDLVLGPSARTARP